MCVGVGASIQKNWAFDKSEERGSSIRSGHRRREGRKTYLDS